ncbi:helix-turn-helix transcriptional regulator [Spirillospora sp. CA-294931]|uniref:helix-turn-helix transcriptional regulator n=1 Tax=Spirillospora sp. CA-294931 TaxID=3240042 RepID=UPI003D8C5134
MNKRPSALSFVILGLLQEARMHPYEMQRLLKERGKDRVLGVEQRSSFYQAIRRLERDGLIAVHETVQSSSRPGRTVYEITENGRADFHRWLRAMLSAPREVFPEFPVAISYLPLLDVGEAVSLLEARREALAATLAETESALAEGGAFLHRLMLLEEELRRAVVAAELAWLTGLIDDLHSGALTWSPELIAEQIARFSPPSAD